MSTARRGDDGGGPPSEGATLIVHVVADGVPLAGARLFVDGALRATSDASGAATVRGLTLGQHHGWVFAKGRADERIDVAVHEDPEAVHERFVTLAPGCMIEGRVVDERGAPVANAWVSVITNDGRLCYQTRSSAAGHWRVSVRAGAYRAHASIGGPWSPLVDFACEGHTPCEVVVRVDPASGLAAPADAGSAQARIAGIVVDTANAPVARAMVIVRASGAHATSSYTFARATATTNERGQFELGGLEEGEHEIVVNAPSFGARREPPAPQRVRAGDLDVRLVVAAGAIAGRVLLDGTPVRYFGMAVTPSKMQGGQPTGIRASDGRFELRPIAPGTWRVSLLAPGTRLAFVDDVRVESGQTTSLGDIALERGVRLAGVVRDASGAPVAGARVLVGWWALHRRDHGSRLEQAFESRYESTSDAAGAYLFDGIEPGRLPQRPAHLWATHPARGASILRELADSDPTIDLVLVATGHIEVVVDGLGGGRAVARAIRADEPPRARTSSIGRDGRCRFESVPAGEYVLQLDLGDLDPVAPVAVTVRGGDTATARLVMTTPTVRLTIRVPDGRGKDLVLEPTSEGARVGGRLRGIVAMGNEDRCRFELVRPGSYRASLDGTRWHPIVVTEDPGEQTIDLRSA